MIDGELKREYKNLTCEGGSNANGHQVYRLWNLLGRRRVFEHAAQPSDVANHLLSTVLGQDYQLAGATAYIFFPSVATPGPFHIDSASTPDGTCNDAEIMSVVYHLTDGSGGVGATVVRPGKDDPRKGIKLSGLRGSAAFVGGGLRYASDSFPSGPPRPLLVFHFATRACFLSNRPLFRWYLGRRDFDHAQLLVEQSRALAAVLGFRRRSAAEHPSRLPQFKRFVKWNNRMWLDVATGNFLPHAAVRLEMDLNTSSLSNWVHVSCLALEKANSLNWAALLPDCALNLFNYLTNESPDFVGFSCTPTFNRTARFFIDAEPVVLTWTDCDGIVGQIVRLCLSKSGKLLEHKFRSCYNSILDSFLVQDELNDQAHRDLGRLDEHLYVYPATDTDGPSSIAVVSRSHLNGGGSSFGQDYVTFLTQTLPPLNGGGRHCAEVFAGPAYIGFSLLAQRLCTRLTVIEWFAEAVAVLHQTVALNGLEGKVGPSQYVAASLEPAIHCRRLKSYMQTSCHVLTERNGIRA